MNDVATLITIVAWEQDSSLRGMWDERQTIWQLAYYTATRVGYQCGVSYACELGPRSAVVCSASRALSLIMQVVVTIYVCGKYEVTVE